MAAVNGILLLITASILSLSCFIQTAAANPVNATRTAPVQRNVLTAQATQLSAEAEQLITLTTAAEHFSALFLPANRALPTALSFYYPV